MASLLSKFRINYESLKMVSGITETPQPETVNFFNNLVEGFSEENVVDPGKRNMWKDNITRNLASQPNLIWLKNECLYTMRLVALQLRYTW
jgi:hypothetical protein